MNTREKIHLQPTGQPEKETRSCRGERRVHEHSGSSPAYNQILRGGEIITEIGYDPRRVFLEELAKYQNQEEAPVGNRAGSESADVQPAQQ